MRGVPEAAELTDPPGVLVDRARGGDSGAWDELVSCFAPLVWAVARGHGLPVATAGDVTHTTFLRLAESLTEVDGGAVGVWLASGARQEALHAVRWLDPRRDLRPRTPADDSDALPLGDALEQLPARARLALRLVAVFGEGTAEVAAGLGLAPAAAADVVAQGLDRLGELLGGRDDLPARLHVSLDDGPPATVRAAARAAYSWRTPDGQLTPTAYDNLLDEGLAAVRGRSGPLVLTFGTDGAELDLEVSVLGDQRLLVGRLSVPGTVSVALADGTESTVTQDHQGFRATVPTGPLRLECSGPDGGLVLRTTWVLV